MPAPTATVAGQQAARRLAQTHYENFSVVSVALPRRLVPHFQAVYAYCRTADDFGDESPTEADALRQLAWLRDELNACYDGEPTHPMMRALRETIRRFQIPRDPFLDLIAAFEQDQHIKEYETFEQLLDYCRRSADPVGRIVLRMLECHDDDKAKLSDRICSALQLTNMWQDVSRDWDIGRIYVPTEDRRRFGVADEDWPAKRFTQAFADLMRFQVDRTRRMFHAGLPLVPRLPRQFRSQIELFAQGGLLVLDKIERAGFNTWNRPKLSKWDKGWLVAKSIARRWLA